ncbi:hypothetical protein DFR76_102821 [Nocardia pseudobrasiliensis]|uniref:Uncharacterized protein n=2 Tax=Nocardia pseudobrasiliensis TaxID=45979 RepID=A0A370ICT1_9NOCA|nr:hypothetical protein DFR76_102821 [Nocardia pseudobrasiliensis]
MSDAVTDAARLLGTGLGAVPGISGPALRLMAVGRPVSRKSRLAVYLAHRDRFWGALERDGVEVPQGTRIDCEIEGQEDELRYGGSIELASPADLPAALEITRTGSAVVLGQFERYEMSDWDSFRIEDVPEPKESRQFLRGAVGRAVGEMFVVRSYGWFDDVYVGSEVFAESRVLDRIESAVAALT